MMTPPSRPSIPPEKIVVTNPDPTQAVKEALELAIKNLSHEIDIRFDGNREAVLIAANGLVDKLKVMEEKITSTEKLVTQQAASNKELVLQQAQANKELVNQSRELTALALTAALQTQEKSAAETRSSIQESIRQLKSGFDESNKTTNEKIDRLTSRADIGQGGFTMGGDTRREDREISRDMRTGSTNMWGIVISIVGVLIAAAAVISAVIVSGHK